MKVNGKIIKANSFAFDGCHKIYVCETNADVQDAIETGYRIMPISMLEQMYACSCSLRFISTWGTFKSYVNQFDDAVFET